MLHLGTNRSLFWRTSSVSGKNIYSAFSPNAPFPVVELDVWEDSNWDAGKYAIRYDANKGFIAQLRELWQRVPRPAVRVQSVSESQALHNTWRAEHCFLLWDAYSVDRCLYSSHISRCSWCCDCYNVSCSENCYECLNCTHCQNLFWAEQCNDCHNSHFLVNCRKCRDCMFCANLENAQYRIFNRQLTREEYETAKARWNFSNRHTIEQAKDEFGDFLLQQAFPHEFIEESEVCSGNYLLRCREAHYSFECEDSENINLCWKLTNARNCLEGMGFGYHLENSAQFVSLGKGAKNVRNCIECGDEVENLTYSLYCERASNLFGCIGIRDAEFCILNRQYSRSSYFATLNEIKKELETKHCWGEFLPLDFSDYGYNGSAAALYMPLGRTQAHLIGFVWDDISDVIKPSRCLGLLMTHLKSTFLRCQLP